MHTIDFQRNFFEESEVVYTGKNNEELPFKLIAWREDGTIIAVEWNKKDCYFHVFPKDSEFKRYLINQGFEEETAEFMNNPFREQLST
jgi:hypothetical protein